ncbi:MAG: dihydrodipicolinate synthase family protein [Parcubacteria group bacterium]|nr:dihydrodipicolinate synthase family protein [Parcubacteria group bacterium]
MNRLPHGIYAMLVTPMDEEGRIDYGALRAEIDWCATHGADGIVVTPSIGEFACLDDIERWACFGVCANHVAKYHPRLRLIATTADTCLWKIRTHTKRARDLGYMAAQVVPPYYWVPDKDEVFQHFSEVAALGLPVVVYHNPKLSKVSISPEFAGRLVRIPGVVGMKEVKTDRQSHLEPLFIEVGGVVPIFTTFRAFSTGLVLGSGGGFVNIFALEAVVAMWRIFDKTGRSVVHRKIEDIQNQTNITFPRGGEDNQRHVGSTKLAASIVTGIDMGKPRAPYMLPKNDFEPQLRKNLAILRETIAA